MGRSYWFECEKCGYRTTVSGGADKGLSFAVQTVACRDCKKLYDAVVKVRMPDEGTLNPLREQGTLAERRLKPMATQKDFIAPPTFQAMLSRLPATGVRRFRWVRFKMRCPVSAVHKVQAWNKPGKCPRCGVLMEQNALPFRLWD